VLQRTTRRRDIKQFSGFAAGTDLAKKKAALDKLFMSDLKRLARAFKLTVGDKKVSLLQAPLAFARATVNRSPRWAAFVNMYRRR
jgi:hypothetical protein